MVNTTLEWVFHGFKGFAKNFFSKIRVYYGSGWVVPGLTRNFFGISSQNNSEPVLIFRSSIPWVYIMDVYTLLKVVGYYDLSVLSMSVMGFQTNKKVWMGCVGGVSSIPSLFWNLEFF